MSTPPPFSLEAYWPYHVAVLGDLVARHTTRVAQEIGGLNLSQWRVLAAVGEMPGRTAQEVVAVTPMDKGIVSRAVQTLVKRGYISRAEVAHDRRQAALSLTPDGDALYGHIGSALSSAFAPVTDALGDADGFLEDLRRAAEAYRTL